MSKINKTIGHFAFLAIPGGLISWLFWADGWKITIAGIVVFVTLTILTAAKNYKAEQKHKDDGGTR